MKSISIDYFKTPFGELILGDFEHKLCLADWRYRKQRTRIDNRIQSFFQADYDLKYSSFLDEVKDQLNNYFKGERKTFDVPIALAGSEFQQKVWRQLIKIPYGRTSSYKELAEKMKMPAGIRAIANANGANAISVIIPCHRVIGSDGKMVGYAGGLNVKEKLLNLEGAIRSSQIKLFE